MAHASPLTSGGDRPLWGSPCAPRRARLLPRHLYWVSLLFCHRSSFVLRCYFQPLALSDVFILVRNWAGEPQSCSRMLPTKERCFPTRRDVLQKARDAPQQPGMLPRIPLQPKEEQQLSTPLETPQKQTLAHPKPRLSFHKTHISFLKKAQACCPAKAAPMPT